MSAPRTANTLSAENYRLLQNHLYQASGIVLEDDKSYLVEARLMPILLQRKLSSLDDLCLRLQHKSEPGLGREVVEAMTINETMFFRDPNLWQAFQASILPELIAKHQISRRLRFWSAACSSGQEAYSLIISVLEAGLANWDIEILGTDLSAQMVNRAQLGRYSLLEIGRGLPSTMLVKYFVRDGLAWQLKPEVRRLARFRQLDLRQPLGVPNTFDIVFCRNVLIYFDVNTKAQVLREIRKTIGHDGYLVLGNAETTLNVDASFDRKKVGSATFYRSS